MLASVIDVDRKTARVVRCPYERLDRKRPYGSKKGKGWIVVTLGLSRSVNEAHLVVHHTGQAASGWIMLLIRRWPGFLLFTKTF